MVEIDVVELLLYFLKKWYLFFIVSLVSLAAGLGICFFLITPKYESTTKIIILNRQDNGSITYSDMQLASQLTKDYEELIVSRDVLEGVIRECGLEDDYEKLMKRVEVENITDTRIISITVEDPSPAQAQMVADCIRETAAEHIRAVTDVEAVNIAEKANFPIEKSSPSTLLWAVLSAGAGFLVVLVILIILFLSDDTIKTAEDIEKYLGLSTLAIIPKADSAGGKKKKFQVNKEGT